MFCENQQASCTCSQIDEIDKLPIMLVSGLSGCLVAVLATIALGGSVPGAQDRTGSQSEISKRLHGEYLQCLLFWFTVSFGTSHVLITRVRDRSHGPQGKPPPELYLDTWEAFEDYCYFTKIGYRPKQAVVFPPSRVLAEPALEDLQDLQEHVDDSSEGKQAPWMVQPLVRPPSASLATLPGRFESRRRDSDKLSPGTSSFHFRQLLSKIPDLGRLSFSNMMRYLSSHDGAGPGKVAGRGGLGFGRAVKGF